MSSGKTAGYQLNQWSLSDKFTMEAFNEDNRRIDTAMTAITQASEQRAQQLQEAMAYEKICGITTTASAMKVDLNVSGVDWSKYLKVQVFFRALQSSYTNCAMYVNVFANNSTSYYTGTAVTDKMFQIGTSLPDSFQGAPHEMFFFPGGGMAVFSLAENVIEGTARHIRAYPKTADDNPLPVSQLSSLNFTVCRTYYSGSQTITEIVPIIAGSTFYIYGVRK